MNCDMASASRTSQIYEALKQELLDGLHPPRSKMHIDQIAERFGVSLSAVREALSRLTSDRLVVAEPQRGFTVAPVSAEDLIDLTEVRMDIENSLPAQIHSARQSRMGRPVARHVASTFADASEVAWRSHYEPGLDAVAYAVS